MNRADEWNERDHIRGKDGKFAPKGSSDTPDKVKEIMGKSYYTRERKVEEIAKALGRLSIGTKFHFEDAGGVVHRFEKVDKGEKGWKTRIKTKDGWSAEMPIDRWQIGAQFLVKK